MKRFVLSTLVVSLSLLLAPIVTAQTPYLQVYFDRDYTETWADCPSAPSGTVVQELYVVANNFDFWISAIEFKMIYPAELYWLGDNVDVFLDRIELSLGNTPEGIAIAWPLPVDGSSPQLVCKVTTLWMCDGCGIPPEGCAGLNSAICFDVFPSSGYVRAVRWPDEQIVYGTGFPAGICPTVCGSNYACPELPVPVESRTWGNIKALYAD